jgi:hypothetical protein
MIASYNIDIDLQYNQCITLKNIPLLTVTSLLWRYLYPFFIIGFWVSRRTPLSCCQLYWCTIICVYSTRSRKATDSERQRDIIDNSSILVGQIWVKVNQYAFKVLIESSLAGTISMSRPDLKEMVPNTSTYIAKNIAGSSNIGFMLAQTYGSFTNSELQDPTNWYYLGNCNNNLHCM